MPSAKKNVQAALPPLLFGPGIALASLVIGGPRHTVPSWRLTIGLVVGLATVAVLGGGGLIATMRRLPDWGYTWLDIQHILG